MSRRTLQPDSWRCPKCRKSHSAAHWKDYHQKEPGWKDKLGEHTGYDKGSDPDYQLVCEVCFTPLTSVVKNKHDEEMNGLRMCPECKVPREGIPAPLFCPHCGYVEDRVILVRING